MFFKIIYQASCNFIKILISFNELNQHYIANREIAFVQAVVSAGIVHTVTRNCSLGHLDNCRCDSSRRDKRSDSGKNGFRWGGCSDNIELGSQIAITFLDKREIDSNL